MDEHEVLKAISFKSAIHGVEVYGLVLITLEGDIVTWNSGAKDLLGYSEEEVVGRNFELFFTPEDRATKVPEQEAAKALAVGYAYDDRWHLRKDGSRIFVNGGLCLLKSDEGAPLGFVKILRDQTERKLHLEKIEELNTNLQEAHKRLEEYASGLEAKVRIRTLSLNERNAELQDFCYSVAHDLRAPLRSIQAMAEVVLEDYGNVMDAKGKDHLQRIKRAGGKLDELTVDLLAYTRFSREEITLSPISLDKVVEEVLANLAETISRKQSSIDVRQPLGSAIGQHAYAVQIIANFLSNSLKFIQRDKPPIIKVWTERKENRIRLYVKDNGIGIPLDYPSSYSLHPWTEAISTALMTTV